VRARYCRFGRKSEKKEAGKEEERHEGARMNVFRGIWFCCCTL